MSVFSVTREAEVEGPQCGATLGYIVKPKIERSVQKHDS